ncbi:MAG: DUF4340 domain-containing protein [Nitrospirae bacterium]|nr:DUF4340 domain-containing protein [Nitrospirota bacterium]
MRYKATLILFLLFLGLVSYLFLIDNPRIKKEAEKKEKAEKLFDFSIDQVRQVELDTSGGHFLMTKNAEEQWMVKNLQGEPTGNVVADSNVVERIIREIHELKPTRIVDEKGEDLKGFGFNMPEKSVTLTMKEGPILKLLIGDEAPLPQTLYLKRGDNGKIYLSNAGIRVIVNYEFWNLRNKHLLSYDQVLIDHVEVKLQDHSWEVAKKGDDWIFPGQPGEKVNEEKLSSFLFSTGTLDGERVLNETGTNLKEFGLAPAYATLIFHIKDKIYTLLVGKSKNEEKITAMGNSEGPIFEIKKDFLNKIPNRNELIKKEPPPSPATTSGVNNTK